MKNLSNEKQQVCSQCIVASHVTTENVDKEPVYKVVLNTKKSPAKHQYKVKVTIESKSEQLHQDFPLNTTRDVQIGSLQTKLQDHSKEQPIDDQSIKEQLAEEKAEEQV